MSGERVEILDRAFGVTPAQMIGERNGLGDDHRINGSFGETFAGVDALGLVGVFPVVPQGRAVDDLILDHRAIVLPGCEQLL